MSRYGIGLGALLLFGAFSAEAGGRLEAAGRIDDTKTGGSCSGVLIAPDIVATAAHCIQGFPNAEALAGVSFLATPPARPVPVAQAFVHPLYDLESTRIEWKFRFDVGLLKLLHAADGSGGGSMPIGEDAQAGEVLFLVSWRESDGDRPRQRACPVLSLGLEGLVTLGCDVRSGESGAPVFRRNKTGEVELVAIVSSRSRFLDQPIAQASNVRLRIPPLLDLVPR